MAKKPLRRAESQEIHYKKRRWEQLAKLRSQATNIMRIFENANIATITHGSIARGDVTSKSDIDIFIPNPPSSFTIETTLERAGIQQYRRLIVQATPNYALKGHIEINPLQTVSFPLAKMRQVERQFYLFGGEIPFYKLEADERAAGVDKRLMLIEPTVKGHIESSIIGREEQTAKLLGLSAETVLDRVHALLRRDEIGRTGLFVERELTPDETFEMVLKKLCETKPEVRRRMKI